MALTTKQRHYISKHHRSKSAKEIAAILKLSESQVTEYIGELEAEEALSPQRKRLFLTIAIAIPILFFVLLELGLRIGNYKGDQSLFVFPEQLDGVYGIANKNFNSRYFFYTQTIPSASNDVFLKEKPANGFRVFVMGGSTTAGYPYGFNGTFSRVTRDMLRDVLPSKHVEVVNVATSAINTYTLYDQVREILAQQPDAIVMYTGHNEFYGALGVGSSESFGAFPAFVRSYLRLQRMKTFMLLREGILKASHFTARLFGNEQEVISGTLMQRMVREQSIPLDSQTYELGKIQFTSNMRAMLRQFERAGVPVFIGSLASNLKDQPPFFSEPTEEHPPADQVFRSGRKAYEAGQFERALERFRYARDLDVLRFRASSNFNALIQELTNEFPNAYYVPVKETLSDASEHGIIGLDLMLEHLHPNSEGYFLMGKAFYLAFAAEDFIGLQAEPGRLQTWNTYRERMELTEFDHRIAWHRIELLVTGWPFVMEIDPMRYPRNYQRISKADSLAFEVVNRGLNWDRAKVQLAEYYRETNQPLKALAEYRGLMREQPFNDSPFVLAARIAIDLNDLEKARPFLEQAYAIQPSGFTCRMLGAIEVDAGNLDRGIALLQEALTFNPSDAQALFNLSGAYGLQRNFDEAMRIALRLEGIQPNFPGLREWKAQLEHILNR